MTANEEIQRRYFDHADRDRYEWTTTGPGFSDVEDEIIDPFLPVIEAPCLEIGCGEGNNLARLQRRARCFGVDLYWPKLAFAGRQLPDVGFAVSDALALPFRSGVFSTVFIRDLLHHVEPPRLVLVEAARVLAPGGNLCLLEPNGGNPLIHLQTLLVPAERGARRSNEAHLRHLLNGLPLTDVRAWPLQPLPLRRLILHYKMGMPSLGRRRLPLRMLVTAERALGRLLPRSRWTYVALTARRAA